VHDKSEDDDESTCTHTHAHTHRTPDRTTNLLISSNVHYVYLGDIEVVGSTPIKMLLLELVTGSGQVNHLYITNVKVSSAFHLSGVGKSSTGPSVEVKAGRVHLCRVPVADNTV